MYRIFLLFRSSEPRHLFFPTARDLPRLVHLVPALAFCDSAPIALPLQTDPSPTFENMSIASLCNSWHFSVWIKGREVIWQRIGKSMGSEPADLSLSSGSHLYSLRGLEQSTKSWSSLFSMANGRNKKNNCKDYERKLGKDLGLKIVDTQ